MDVAKELKESKKTADETNAMRLKKLGKRYVFAIYNPSDLLPNYREHEKCYVVLERRQ